MDLVGLGLCVAVALLVRWIGIDFGAPSAGCRPDEEISLREALHLLEGNPHIHFFNYPPGLMFLEAYWIGFAQRLGFLPEDGLVSYAIDPMPFHVASRWLSAFTGVLTVVLVHAIGRRLFGGRAALLAGLALAVMPLHMLHSHFATLDVPGTFFMTLAIWLAIRTGASGSGLLWPVLSAAAAGVAAGIKYPFGAVLIVPLSRVFEYRHFARACAGFLSVALCAFTATAPTFLLQYTGAIDGIRDEAAAQSTSRAFWTGANPLLYHLWESFLRGGGFTLFPIFILGVALAAKTCRRSLVILVPGAILYVLHGLFGNVYMRYMVPVAPMLCVFAGFALGAEVFWRRRYVGVALALLVLSVPTFMTIRTLETLAAKDSRGELLECFEDGRLSRAVIVLVPPAPLRIFPFAAMSQVMQSAAFLSDRDPCNRNIGMAMSRILERRDSERALTDVRVFDEKSFPAMLDGLRGKEVLVVIPTTFTNYFEWHRDQVAILEARAAAGELEFNRVLRLDPTEGRGFLPRQNYDPHDFWFIPSADPRGVARPGPMIDVYRVFVH